MVKPGLESSLFNKHISVWYISCCSFPLSIKYRMRLPYSFIWELYVKSTCRIGSLLVYYINKLAFSSSLFTLFFKKQNSRKYISLLGHRVYITQIRAWGNPGPKFNDNGKIWNGKKFLMLKNFSSPGNCESLVYKLKSRLAIKHTLRYLKEMSSCSPG